jgi:nitronate monooxygenase
MSMAESSVADPASTRLSAVLGCPLPIVLAGMGGVARSELVAAVAEAGGFGFLGMVRESPELIRREVEAVRRRGVTRFGVNIIPAATDPALLAQQVETILALEVPVVALFWDLDAPLVRRFNEAGVLVAWQVGSRDEAVAAEQAGAGLIIAQGREAGGHVRGTTPLRRLLPDVVAAVEAPVLAAGGLATGNDLVTARAFGAEGIVVGTALAAAEESFAHAYHKQRLVLGNARDTLLTEIFHINWPRKATVRVLSSAVTAGGRGIERPDRRVAIGDEEGRPIYLFSTDSPLRSMTGDFEAMALYAGTGVGSIGAIRPAGEILRKICEGARVAPIGADTAEQAAIERASPVCYVGEMSGAYVGQLEAVEVAEEMAQLLAELRALLAVMAERSVAPDDENVPPFGPDAVALARWIAGLAAAWEQAGGPAAHADGTASLPLERLARLATGLPEGALRAAIVDLRQWLEARRQHVASAPERVASPAL